MSIFEMRKQDFFLLYAEAIFATYGFLYVRNVKSPLEMQCE